jgi:hypothetical protein
MPIKLTYRAERSRGSLGADADWAWDKTPAEMGAVRNLFHGNRKLPLAEMFTVASDVSDKRQVNL